MEIQDLKVGDVVCIIDARLNEGGPSDVQVAIANPRAPFGREAVVVAIQDVEANPGKWVALCLREAWPGAHECDGLVPMGHGWWSRPEHLYTMADREAHLAASSERKKQKMAARAVVERFLETVRAADIGELKL